MEDNQNVYDTVKTEVKTENEIQEDDTEGVDNDIHYLEIDRNSDDNEGIGDKKADTASERGCLDREESKRIPCECEMEEAEQFQGDYPEILDKNDIQTVLKLEINTDDHEIDYNGSVENFVKVEKIEVSETFFTEQNIVTQQGINSDSVNENGSLRKTSRRRTAKFQASTSKKKDRNGSFKNCKFCSESHTPDIHKKHRKKTPKPKSETYKCDLCDFETNYKPILDEHRRRTHELMRCEWCDYQTISEKRFERHRERLHLNTIIYKCELCDFTSSSKANVQVHFDAVHLKLKKYSCELCDYKAARKGEIKGHTLSKHMQIKKFKCGFCEFAFFSKSSVIRHIRNIHLKVKKPKMVVDNYNSKNYKCDLCDYTVMDNFSFRRHTQIVHSKSDLKIIWCPFCNFTSLSQASMDVHISSLHQNIYSINV